MSFRLRKKSLAHEVRRVARKALEGGLKAVLTIEEQGCDTAVHEARKHIKQIRALVRLLRPAMGDAFYELENAALREAARRMSPVRDAHVRVRTIESLTTRSRVHRAEFAHVQEAMRARLLQVLAESGKDDWCRHVTADLEHAICRLDGWPVEQIDASSLREGLKSAVKKARRALAVARDDPTDINLHKLRKRIKDVWYDLQLLAGNQPAPVKALTKSFRELGEKLGNDHDLAMLLAARDENPLPDPGDWEALEQAIAAHRRRSQRAVFRLAVSVLARKPRAFADFVLDRWEKWRARA